MTLEGDDKLVQSQAGDVPSMLTRQLTDDNTLTMVSGALAVHTGYVSPHKHT